MAHSPRAQHRGPVHGCGRPSTPCRSAGRAQETHGPRLVLRQCRQHRQVGRVAGATAGLAASWARSCSLRPSPAPGPCPVPRPARGVPELLCGSTVALGQPREQALSKRPQMTGCRHVWWGSPWNDCWRLTELLGQNGSSRGRGGTLQDPSVRQGQAGAPGSAARTGGTAGFGGLAAVVLAQLCLHQTWCVAKASSGWPSASGTSVDRHTRSQGRGCARGFAPGPAWPHTATHTDPSARGHVLPLLHGAAAALPAARSPHATCTRSSVSPGSCPGPTAHWHASGSVWAPAGA